MSDENLPDIYSDLLDRVERIESTLSRDLPKSDNSAIHAQEEQASQLDEEDLDTEKITPVTVKSGAFLKMAVHAKKYANRNIPKEGWVEVIGLLTGDVINEDTPIEQIRVKDAWPIGHGDAVSVEIMDTGSVTKIMTQLNETRKGDFIIGWYHSHPSYGNFLSIDDYNTQNRYQTLWSKAIAIVIDPMKISKSNYGFGVFRNTTKEPRSKGYTELSADVEGLSPKAAHEVLNLVRPAYEGKGMNFLEYE